MSAKSKPKKKRSEKNSITDDYTQEEIMAMAQRFKILRKDVYRFSQKQLSEILKTTQGSISHIEHGFSAPSANYIKRLVKLFPDTNLNWIFYNEGEPTRSKEIQNAATKTKDDVLKQEQRKAKKEIDELKSQIEKLIEHNSQLIKIVGKRK